MVNYDSTEMDPRIVTPSPDNNNNITKNTTSIEDIITEFNYPFSPLFTSPESSQDDMLAVRPPSPPPLRRSCGRCSCTCDTRNQGYCKTFGAKIKTEEDIAKLFSS